MERKRVDLSWYEKHDITENELGYIEQLLDIDRTLGECDTILAEVGLQTGYSSLADEILEIMEKRQHLWQFVLALPEHIQFHLDEPLRQALNHGACETISRIHAEDFQVENRLGITVEVAARGYSATVAKDRLTLKDFLGNAVGETAGSVIPNLSGRTNGCVEEFASVFSQQYENLLSEGMLDTDCRDLEDYLEGLARMGEYDHKEDHPFYEMLVSSLLDLTIIKPLIEIGCGYDLITGEDLTELERGMKLVGAAVDLITLATGLYGFSVAAKNMGKKEVLRYFAQMALCELAADVSATTVATIGEYNDWPAGLTLLLSLGTGLTVGRIGNQLIFERNGIEILRREIPEGGTAPQDYSVLSGVEIDDVMRPGGGGIEGDLDTIIKNGKVSIDDIKTNPSAFSGKTAEEIADVLRNSGYDVTIKNSTRSRSGAQIIQINNPGGGKNISQVQVSPGGGRHGSNPYVKISTTDQGIIKIVDGIESAYKTDGKETATIIFSGGN